MSALNLPLGFPFSIYTQRKYFWMCNAIFTVRKPDLWGEATTACGVIVCPEYL